MKVKIVYTDQIVVELRDENGAYFGDNMEIKYFLC